MRNDFPSAGTSTSIEAACRAASRAAPCACGRLSAHAPRVLSRRKETECTERSTRCILTFAEQLRSRGAGLRMLLLGRGDMDASTPRGSLVFTMMAALAQRELQVTRERIPDPVAQRRAAGKIFGGRRPTFTDSRVRNALRLIESWEPVTHVARDLGMSKAILHRCIRELPVLTT